MQVKLIILNFKNLGFWGFGEKAVKKKPALKNDLSTQFPFAPEYDDETGDATGNIKFRVKAKAKITTRDGKTFTQSVAVVDAKRTPMDGSVLVGNGSTGKVAFEAAPYTMMATKKSGASLRLKAVQVIDLVEHGSTPTSIFDEEDGFESQTTAKSEASSVFEEEVATDDDDF